MSVVILATSVEIEKFPTRATAGVGKVRKRKLKSGIRWKLRKFNELDLTVFLLIKW